MLATRSRVTTDDAGWTWLEPERHSLTLRHGLMSIVLSVLFVVAAAAATLPPRVVAVPLLALVVGVGALLARQTWRETHSRVGVSALGVLLQQGTSQEQLGWPSLVAITGERRRRRVRIRVVTSAETTLTSATYGLEPARRWLDECRDHARQRRLEPLPGPDGLGFTAGDRGR